MLRSEEGIGEHKSKDTKNHEGQSGTIYSANNGMGNANSGTCSQIDYKGTINDISTRRITEGAEAKGTTNDIFT